MKQRYKLAGLWLLIMGLAGGFAYFVGRSDLAVLQPAGIIASQERDLMVIAVLLGLLVIIPVFALTFFIVWRYREGSTRGKYQPEDDHNAVLETLWWGIPCVIIGILSVITWKSSHDLDPFKPLSSSAKPMTVQVVALPWKWLFIYPEQGIATVNYVRFPAATPIKFQLTADAPMNSFWIPRLGGQIYAMPAMSTHLHLMADKPGEFRGSSANLSGSGFAGMAFRAQASTPADFNNWVKIVKFAPGDLNMENYEVLAKPSRNSEESDYSSVDKNLYDRVIKKYTEPAAGVQRTNEKSLDHGGTHH